VELFEQMRREYEHGAGTIKGVARKFGVHRRMVREAISNAVPPSRKIPERDRPKLAPAMPFIEQMLQADRRAPRKQRHTAHRIWQRLKAEHPEVDVAESTVRRYVRGRKQELGLAKAEVFIPQSYRWGQEAQVDWYEAYVDMDGEEQKVYLFCMRSMASGGAFHRAYPHAIQQAFLEAHELAFAYFGGVFERLRYDNLTSAVKRILRGSRREETERFIAFRSHWGFASEFCTPGGTGAHEKGGVEGENGYFRRNHLVPLPKVGSWEELNRFLLEESKRDEQRVIGDRNHTVGAGLCLEREHLLPLAEEGFQLAAISFPAVNSSRCARVLTNYYSVPAPVGCEVEAKVYAAQIEFWYEGKCIACHDRCFNRQKKILDLEHYLDALSKKPGALAGSSALEQWRGQGKWPASFDRLWEELKKRRGKQDGTRAMIDLLLLGRAHGYDALRNAIEKTVAIGCMDVSAVVLLLNGHGGELRPSAEPVEIGALSRYDRPQPTLTDYDQLLRKWPETGVIQ
jgi:transposase